MSTKPDVKKARAERQRQRAARDDGKSREERYEQRNAEVGFVKVSVRVPQERRETLLDTVAKWRADALGGKL